MPREAIGNRARLLFMLIDLLLRCFSHLYLGLYIPRAELKDMAFLGAKPWLFLMLLDGCVDYRILPFRNPIL